MNKKVSIIDYNTGNIRSVINAISKFNVDVFLTDNHDKILQSDAIVLPGVGSFSYGMHNLRQKKLERIIHKFVDSGKPVLGICLGMQLMMESSSEFGNTSGLCLFEGAVEKLPGDSGFLVPHIGWEGVKFSGSEQEEDFFFCHSYVAVPKNTNEVYATTLCSNYRFCSAIKRENVIGYQFHPEKSSKSGVKLIQSFVEKI
ncbi:MAG TPA: imidazole glycerol phosphate synthase subunit HisH [Flavobacteriaceae bacterium]|nr:imidazole glycerol phosphate synthase subunit HisH [Flavobacteriaceae bacterium]